MKIAPLQISDPWFHRLARNDGVDARALNAVPCDIAVRMEVVSLLHHGADQNYRPYLHLRGQIIQVQPEVALPFGITELPYRSGSEPALDAFYEFDTAQLAELIDKGYFGPRFRVPDTMVGIVWELPARADLLVVAPENVDQPPLVFVGIHEQAGAVLTEENSGYALAEYFPDYSVEASEEIEGEARASVPTHSEEIKDLFADEELDEALHRGSGPVRRVPETAREEPGRLPGGAFDRLLEEMEARREAEEPLKRPGVDYVPDSPEGLLRERITPGVERALSDPMEAGGTETSGSGSRRAEERGADPDALLDWDAEETNEEGTTPASTIRTRTRDHLMTRPRGGSEGKEDDHQPGA
ncbi:AAA family ATPase [Nocardiopsis alba]|uniref:AAA family ATPase n=1 Tax=Nocardiopsis alba TaxID=53437 RepID=UPI0035DFFF78